MTLGILLVFLKLLLLVSAFPTSIVDADQNLTSLVARDGPGFQPNLPKPNYVLLVQVTKQTVNLLMTIDFYNIKYQNELEAKGVVERGSPKFKYSTTLSSMQQLSAISTGQQLLITPVPVGKVNNYWRTLSSRHLPPFYMDFNLIPTRGIGNVRLESPCRGEWIKKKKQIHVYVDKISFPVYIQKK